MSIQQVFFKISNVPINELQNKLAINIFKGSFFFRMLCKTSVVISFCNKHNNILAYWKRSLNNSNDIVFLLRN
jgi:hypothetical protein